MFAKKGLLRYGTHVHSTKRSKMNNAFTGMILVYIGLILFIAVVYYYIVKKLRKNDEERLAYDEWEKAEIAKDAQKLFDGIKAQQLAALQVRSKAYASHVQDVATSDTETYANECASIILQSSKQNAKSQTHQTVDQDAPGYKIHTDTMHIDDEIVLHKKTVSLLRNQFPAAKQVIQILAEDHLNAVSLANETLAHAEHILQTVETNIAYAESLKSISLLLDWTLDDINRDLHHAEQCLQEPAKILARLNKQRAHVFTVNEEIQKLLPLTPTFSQSATDTHESLANKHLASRLKVIALTRSGYVLEDISKLGPKDWANLDRRLTHAYHELCLTFWIVGLEKPLC